MDASKLIDGSGNNLLRALRPHDAATLLPFLRTLEVEAGEILYEPGDDVRAVYFPAGRTLVSFMVELADGRGVETALVGREGAVSGIVSRGRLPAYARCVVQYGGPMHTMALEDLEACKAQSPTLNNLFARYADCMVAQVFQSVACNAAHSLEQRSAKWLLAAIDRTGENAFAMTQEQLAGMLGVGRSYMSRVLGMLRARGILTVARGRLIVEDIDALHALSCDCNRQVRHHFNVVLAGVYPTPEDDVVAA